MLRIRIERDEPKNANARGWPNPYYPGIFRAAVLEQFRFVRALGEGVYGSVSLATDATTSSYVVIKRISAPVSDDGGVVWLQ